MPTGSLGPDFVARLRSQGSTTDEAQALRAAKAARLLLMHSISLREAHPHLPAAAPLLARLSGLPQGEAALLVDLAVSPEYRPVRGSDDLDAFIARFGPAAGRRILELEEEETDLGRYALDQGPAEAVRLLEAMIELAAADRRLTGDEARRLEAAAEELWIDPSISMALQRKHAPDAVTRGEPIRLHGERVAIGRAPGSGVRLPHPQVAPHHADLLRGADGWRVVDARSGRATVLDGRAVRSAPFRPGQELRIGPYQLRLDPDGEQLRASAEVRAHGLRVQGLRRHIGTLSLLDDISFAASTGEVVAIVGPSGAGKTTLLTAITGQARADEGQILFDGRDFHAALAEEPDLVGSVPQDDIVLPDLTVEESLRYGARLRLRGAEAADPQAPVDRVLVELGIPHIRGARIGDALRRGISGGQRKRVNLGQELLSPRTRVLFLDEPTSGLDPKAAQEIVRLVRQLADRGRLVFLVTHDLSPQVIAQVDHLMVLVPGGRLAWFGPPAEACRAFGVETPDAIFDRLGDRAPEEWARAFRTSPAWRRFVGSRLSTEVEEGPREEAPSATPDGPPARISPGREAAVLASRYLKVKLRDRTGLVVLGLQPPFLAAIMGLVFPQPTAPMLFMLTLACLWFGMSGAVRELITDRAVWRRERRVGVRVGTWLFSKTAVLGALVVLQCSFLSLALWARFDLAALGYAPQVLAGVAALVGLCGMALGLLVSALFSSSEAAVGSLPLLLIPQITLSSLLVNLREMNTLSLWLSRFNPLRYAFEAMLKTGLQVAVPERIPGRWRLASTSAPLYDHGFKSAAVEDMGLGMGALLLTLSAFTVLFLTGSVLRTLTRDD